MDSAVLLQHLHAIYEEIADNHEYSKDLPTYLKYRRDVVFDGSKEQSYDNYEEQRMIEILRNFYQNEKNTTKPSEHAGKSNTSFNRLRLTDEGHIRRTSKMKNVRRECFNDPSLDDGTCRVDDFPGSLNNDNSSRLRHMVKTQFSTRTAVQEKL
ncbi:hypothetical protein MtrunA17_Chr5g0428231 [Medicago truncatula]|uniref:Uncharacterized protein n=1 Tax=Medicago truncatula TaxID=3880 RepID=A0A396HUY7_MEDTR|nr:hypothetical protein MtrunA17_Chr5g0428231 [Medicago truncatula]